MKEIEGGSGGEQNPTTIDTSYFFWGKEDEGKKETIEIADGEGGVTPS